MKKKGMLAWYEDEDTVQFVVTVRKRVGHDLDARDQTHWGTTDVGLVRKAIIERATTWGLDVAISGRRVPK